MRLMLAVAAAAALVVAGCVQPPADVANQACDDDEVVTGIASDGRLQCSPVTWEEVDGIPTGFADGTDADRLRDLSCRNGQTLLRTSGGWECVDAGPSGTEKITRIVYSGSYVDDEADLDWHRLSDVGTFTKDFSDTILMVHWNGHAEVDAGGGIGTCVFQLRIDDLNSLGSASETSVTGAVVIIGDTDKAIPFQVTDVFQQVGSGSHDVSIWIRGTPVECFLNPGNFKHTIIIEEKTV